MSETVVVSFCGRVATLQIDPTLKGLFEAAKRSKQLGLKPTDHEDNIVVGREEVVGEVGSRVESDGDLRDALFLKKRLVMVKKSIKRAAYETRAVGIESINEKVKAKRPKTLPEATIQQHRTLSSHNELTSERDIFMAAQCCRDEYGVPLSPKEIYSLLTTPKVHFYNVQCRDKHFEVVKLHPSSDSMPHWQCYASDHNCLVWTCKEALLREVLQYQAEEDKEIPKAVLRATSTSTEWQFIQVL